jgi:glycosyltransferase involved in cell wall biosynthesis
MAPETDTRRRRVLFLNSCVSGGGAGRSFQAYIENLDDRIEAYVVMPEPGVIGPQLQNAARVYYVPEFAERIHRCSYRWVEKLGWRWLHVAANCFGLPRAMFKIIRICRELKPDLIYANHMLANPVGAFIGWRTGIPVVFHARNIHVAWLGRKFYRFLAGRKDVKRVICNSLASSLIYREYTEEKVRVVYNFVDLKKFDRSIVSPCLRRERNIPGDALVIGYIGRILPKKGIDVLLHAFSRIYSKYPNAYLALIGENDGGLHEDLRSQYRALTQVLGISKRTFFVGFKDDIRPYVADFDILALPSVEPESFGRVLIEAMAMGVPSVVSALGGAPEVVRSGLNGLWCIPGDPVDLARALEELLSDEELRDRMGRYGSSYVQKNFSAQDLSRQITDVLCDIDDPSPAEGDWLHTNVRLFQKRQSAAKKNWELNARHSSRSKSLDRR